MVPEEAQTTILCGRRSLHSVYPVPGSCSYTGATSIVFVKWLELIRIQMIAASELRGWFVGTAYKTEGFFLFLFFFLAEEPKQSKHDYVF